MYKLFTDGGARGNPGPAGIGMVLKQDDIEIISKGVYLGVRTNNQAEYSALIEGLRMALQQNISELNCYMDSELLVKQLSGEYRVKNKELQDLWKEVKVLMKEFKMIQCFHVRREYNTEADAMVNQAIDNALQ